MTRKFTIDRRTWIRGNSEESALLRNDGCQCCMGQIARQCGVSDSQLLELSYISSLPVMSEVAWLLKRLREECDWVDLAYEINDSGDLSDPARESQLIALAA